MDTELKLIIGGSHTDNGGNIVFINDFDMQAVKRFYRIKHPDIDTIRGGSGHKIEQRWFHVSFGAFLVKLIKIDDWITPHPWLPIKKIVLKEADHAVLRIPSGYATAVQALEENSEFMVFANYPIEHAKDDDYLFPVDYFKTKHEN
ncbi:cupin domain-containing protein [Pedobacter helvus]|uniref:Sugar 3,4-ketoisomerase QdtA cupin domain-containing protein n=1 Tax=Pedobacter helvus TaxID=2563444 RepID=A0ABW9JFH7_9SPHI|nr:sugar epimerase [Pedobacter ureilyticus]